MTPPHHDIDPFQLELMKSCFDTIADDMALTLMRTAHSGIVRDSLDRSVDLPATRRLREQMRTAATGRAGIRT